MGSIGSQDLAAGLRDEDHILNIETLDAANVAGDLHCQNHAGLQGTGGSGVDVGSFCGGGTHGDTVTLMAAAVGGIGFLHIVIGNVVKLVDGQTGLCSCDHPALAFVQPVLQLVKSGIGTLHDPGAGSIGEVEVKFRANTGIELDNVTLLNHSFAGDGQTGAGLTGGEHGPGAGAAHAAGNDALPEGIDHFPLGGAGLCDLADLGESLVCHGAELAVHGDFLGGLNAAGKDEHVGDIGILCLGESGAQAVVVVVGQIVHFHAQLLVSQVHFLDHLLQHVHGALHDGRSGNDGTVGDLVPGLDANPGIVLADDEAAGTLDFKGGNLKVHSGQLGGNILTGRDHGHREAGLTGHSVLVAGKTGDIVEVLGRRNDGAIQATLPEQFLDSAFLRQHDEILLQFRTLSCVYIYLVTRPFRARTWS